MQCFRFCDASVFPRQTVQHNHGQSEIFGDTMRIAPWLYSFLPPIIPPGRKEWQLCNVSGFGRLFLSRRCRGRGVCRIFRRLRQSIFIAPLVMLRHDAADILHSPFGRTIEKIVVDADRSAGVFHSRHFHRIPSLSRLVWSEFGIFITGHTDGCWRQLHGNLTPAHAYGCGAQCFAGVQCASIFNPVCASLPASRHACFAARCVSLVRLGSPQSRKTLWGEEEQRND